MAFPDDCLYSKLYKKTKIKKELKNHFNILKMSNDKTKKSILDSLKKNIISLEKKKMKELDRNEMGEKNRKKIEITIRKENSNRSLKTAFSSEKMSIIHEDEFEKNKSNNYSLNNIDNSYGEIYSTANSNSESYKIKIKQNLIKEKIEYAIIGKPKYVQEMETIKQNEKDNVCNFQNVDEYIDDILENLIKEEKNIININPNYFEYQKEINQSMRSILIDWLIDVHNKLNFKEETLYITIYIIDSYLSKKSIERKRFQLLGTTALLIATKLNEIYCRRIIDYVLLTDNAYTKDDIKRMEEEIVKTLNFNFLIPSPLSFFEIIIKILGISEDKDLYNLGEFLLQTFLIDFRSLYYSYSIIAYAICYIIMKLYKMKNNQFCFDDIIFFLVNKNMYENKVNIIECADVVFGVLKEIVNSNLKSTIKKYSSHNFDDIIVKICEYSKNN